MTPHPISGPVPTLWASDGSDSAFALAADLLAECRPPAVQVHSWQGGRAIGAIRALLPGVQVVMGVGVDGVAREVASGRRDVVWGIGTLYELALRAASLGCVAICWDAEASWKRPPGSEERIRLIALIVAVLGKVASRLPTLEQWHTSYDHPTYHSSYPWLDWIGPQSPVTIALPQVYAAPAGGLMARRGGLDRREARALSSWAEAVRRGWIDKDAPEGSEADLADVDWRPYYQLHHVTAADTIDSAIAHPMACLWAVPTRSDRDGRNALRGLCELHRRGFWAADGVQILQAAVGAKVDGIFGPDTARRAGIAWESGG